MSTELPLAEVRCPATDEATDTFQPFTGFSAFGPLTERALVSGALLTIDK
jgi:hypothetical protein